MVKKRKGESDHKREQRLVDEAQEAREAHLGAEESLDAKVRESIKKHGA